MSALRRVKEKPAVLVAFLVLIGCQLVGELLRNALHLPLPGAVIGMLLYAAALAGGHARRLYQRAVAAARLRGHGVGESGADRDSGGGRNSPCHRNTLSALFCRRAVHQFPSGPGDGGPRSSARAQSASHP